MWLSALSSLLVALPIVCLCSATASDVVSLLIVLVGIGAYVRDARFRDALRGDPVFPATLAYVSALVLSMVAAPRYNVVFGVLTLLFPLVLPVAVAVFRLRPETRRSVGIAAVVMIVVSFVTSLVQLFGLHPIRVPRSEWSYWKLRPDRELYRATGLFKHPIHFAATTATLAFWFLGGLVYARGSEVPRRWLLLFGSLAVVTAIVTFTKSVWLGLVAGLLALAVIAPAGPARRAVLGGLVTLAIAVASFPIVRERYIYWLPQNQQSRLLLWETSTRMFLDAPVLGQGHQAFRDRVDKYLPEAFVAEHRAALDPHNMYLETLSGSGLVGFTLMLLWLGVVGFRLFARRAEASPEAMRWRAAAWASWAFLLVAGTFDHFLTQRQTTPMILTLWAAGLAHVPPSAPVPRTRPALS